MIYPAFAAARDRANLVLPLFCLAAVVANQAIFRLGAMSPFWPMILVLTIIALYLLAPHFEAIGQRPRERLRIENPLIGLLVLAPLLADLVLGWNREFPFSGDSYFQVGQSYRIAYWWLSPLGSDVVKVPTLDDVRHLLSGPLTLLGSRIVVLMIVGAVTMLLYRRWRSAALAFAVVAMIAWGCAEQTIFLRYPGAGYLIVLPLLGPAFALNNLELAGRLSGVLSAVAWLFVLRPWLIGRWPDVRVLPAALLLFWQKDIIYYFDSVYLEPWGFVCCLLAAEALIVKGREAAPLACLLVGVAATIKEPFVIALPLMWLAGQPWRSRDDFVKLSAAAVAAGLPFVIYTAARNSIDVADLGSSRSVIISVSTQSLEKYATEFAKQMPIAFPGTSGLLAVAALLAALIALWLASDRRFTLACVLAAGCAIALLFALDFGSQMWAGYFRFLMYSLPFLAGGVMLLARTVQPRWALAMAGAALFFQAPSAYIALARAAGPSTERNFVEHYDAPLVFPMKSLTAEARKTGALNRNAPVMANLVDGTLRPLPGSPIVYGPLLKMYCECSREHPNVLALFVRFTNQLKDSAHRNFSVGSRIDNWQKTDAQREPCLAELKRTCAHVFTRVEAGELVGALGTQH